MKKINIVIADDHQLLRHGIQRLLQLEPQIAVVGMAGDGQEALDACRLLSPDILLLDINMPVMDGKEALRRLRDMGLATRVIVLTVDDALSDLEEAIQLGAKGYLLKGTDLDTLILAIKTVFSGKTFIQPTLELALEQHQANGKNKDDLVSLLTPRELDVLRLVSHGASNREIAQMLFISEKTVKNHLSNIFKKLNVSDRTQAAIYSLKHKN